MLHLFFKMKASLYHSQNKNVLTLEASRPSNMKRGKLAVNRQHRDLILPAQIFAKETESEDVKSKVEKSRFLSTYHLHYKLIIA